MAHITLPMTIITMTVVVVVVVMKMMMMTNDELKSLFLHCISLDEIMHKCDKSLRYVKMWETISW
jgi:hypothetical protein